MLAVYFSHLFMRTSGINFVGQVDMNSFGQTGVLIFFVHTSLVLMLSMERMDVAKHDLAMAFYVRRFFRIYPLSMVAVVFAALFRIPPNPTLHYQWIGWAAFWSNFGLVQNLTRSKYILGPLWSLPLECQMYILLPPIFFLMMRFRGWIVPFALWAISVVAALAMVRYHGSPRLLLFYFAPCFLGGIMAFGMLRYRSLRLPFWGWPIIIAVIFAIRQLSFQYSWLGCLLLGITAPQFKEMTQPYLRKAAALVARYSYGIYLSHIIIFYYVGVSMRGTPMVIRVAVCIVATVACPVILYHTVEKPMIKVGINLADRFVSRRVSVSAYELAPIPTVATDPEYPPAP